MRKDLVERWQIKAITVHDKPPKWNLAYERVVLIANNASQRLRVFQPLIERVAAER